MHHAVGLGEAGIGEVIEDIEDGDTIERPIWERKRGSLTSNASGRMTSSAAALGSRYSKTRSIASSGPAMKPSRDIGETSMSLPRKSFV